MDIALADRIQFSLTVMFHYLFPITTMGLAPFVAWFTVRAWRTQDERRTRVALFWTKIFALSFAMGVITGIPMEFQFGTNWAQFSHRAGSVLGAPLSLEGIYAFFLESIFLGALLYGRHAKPKRLQAVSSVFVWLGSWLSGYFVTATDAWMQHPVGYRVASGGLIELSNLWTVLFSQFAVWQFLHVLCGAMVTGGFIVAGLGAFYVLAGRENENGREFVRSGVIVACVFSLLTIFPTGDRNGADVTTFQPIKLAAMEGLFDNAAGAPLAIIGMPDAQKGALIDPLYVPGVLSYLAYGNFHANVKGLHAYATAMWPPVELTYYAYHIMVGLGTIFVAISVLAALLLWHRALFEARPMLWILMLSMPFPYIANEAGWTTTEVGRQPWIIYGLMKTADGVSPNVVSGEALFTILGFTGIYFILGILFIYLTVREIATGPSGEEGPAYGLESPA